MTTASDSTEEKIRAAAKKLFTERGFEGTKIRDVAEEAGVNIALLNYYFRSKDKLFAAIFAENYKEFFRKSSETLLNEKVSLKQRITDFFETMTKQLLEAPDLPMFLMSEVHRNPGFCGEIMDMKTERNLTGRFIQQIDVEVELGNIRPIDPKVLESLIVSLIVFPFIFMPMMKSMHGLSDEGFIEFLERRKTIALDMVLSYLYAQ